MNTDEILKEVSKVIDSNLDINTKRNELILLQSLATLDSTETAWAVSLMIEPFIMEVNEKGKSYER